MNARMQLSITLIASLMFAALPRTAAAQPPPYLMQWGTHGSGNLQFNLAYPVAVDPSGNVYVCDVGNSRIMKFTGTGAYITKWSIPAQAYGLAFGNGNVYAALTFSNIVQIYSSSGTFISQFGGAGSGPGQFNGVFGLGLDGSGNVYAADANNHRIQKFTSVGGYLAQWGLTSNELPKGLAIDSGGNVYVSETVNNRIKKYTGSGTFITQWGSAGAGPGQFNSPDYIALDAGGNVYVSDYNNHRIQEFTGAGSYLTEWGTLGNGNNQFNHPEGIAVDAAGSVYVSDLLNYRILKFGDVTPPTVTLTSPNGGEVWTPGSSHNITWSASDDVGVTSIDLALSLDNGGSWQSIASGLANSGTYAWTVPYLSATQALVEVRAWDARSNTTTDASNAVFQITDGSRPVVADPRLAVPDGPVLTTAIDGNTLYFGGSFSHVGRIIGGFATLDLATGKALGAWPIVDATVNAVIPDGTGGYYLGGSFRRVGGVRRSGLAHLRADGTLDEWNPAGSYGSVMALTLADNRLYVGGAFDSLGGAARKNLACIDLSSGSATPWNPQPNGKVNAMACYAGKLYFGGEFSNVSGVLRSCLAAVDTVLGAVKAWNPGANMYVYTLVAQNGVVYAGGEFTTVHGVARRCLAALDTSAGVPTGWNPNPNSRVNQLVGAGSTLYVCGYFSTVAGQPRGSIAAVDTVTGEPTSWSPTLLDSGAPAITQAIAVGSGTVYVGGTFDTVNGVARKGIAAIDAASGSVATWDPSSVRASFATLQLAGGVLVAGGYFPSVGMERRHYLAAIDLQTGGLEPWDPDANGSVSAMAMWANGDVLVGGFFTSLDGWPRNYLAMLSNLDGSPLAWAPVVSGPVRRLAANSLLVYALFDDKNTKPTAIAANGLVYTAFDDTATSAFRLFEDIVATNAAVYLGGRSVARDGRNLCALDPITGAQAWNILDNPDIESLGHGGGTLYAGAGSQTASVFAVDALTGTIKWATGWGNGSYGDIYAFAVDNEAVYVGGEMDYVGGANRRGLAALDPVSGLTTPWRADVIGYPGYEVRSLLLDADALVVGGYFAGIEGGYFSDISSGSNPNLARLLPTLRTPMSVQVLGPGGGDVFVPGDSLTVSWTASGPRPGIQDVDLYVSRYGPSGPWELIAAAVRNTGSYRWMVTGPVPSSICYARVDARNWADSTSTAISSSPFWIVGSLVGVGTTPAFEGLRFSAAPNPADAKATISYVLPRDCDVRLRVLDVQGRSVEEVVHQRVSAGVHSENLDTRRLHSGLYFLVLRAGGETRQQKLLVVR